MVLVDSKLLFTFSVLVVGVEKVEDGGEDNVESEERRRFPVKLLFFPLVGMLVFWDDCVVDTNSDVAEEEGGVGRGVTMDCVNSVAAVEEKEEEEGGETMDCAIIASICFLVGISVILLFECIFVCELAAAMIIPEGAVVVDCCDDCFIVPV